MSVPGFAPRRRSRTRARAGFLPPLGSDGFHRLEDHRVALRFHFIALLHTEGLIEDFRLQAVGDELALRRPLGDRGPDLAVREEDAEPVEYVSGDLEFRVDLLAAQELGSEVSEAGAGIEHVAQTVGVRRVPHDVGLDAAAAGHWPPF